MAIDTEKKRRAARDVGGITNAPTIDPGTDAASARRQAAGNYAFAPMAVMGDPRAVVSQSAVASLSNSSVSSVLANAKRSQLANASASSAVANSTATVVTVSARST